MLFGTLPFIINRLYVNREIVVADLVMIIIGLIMGPFAIIFLVGFLLNDDIADKVIFSIKKKND